MILDRSKNFLDIFVRPFEIDTNLPKYKKNETKEGIPNKISNYYSFEESNGLNTNLAMGFPPTNDSGEKNKKNIFTKLFGKRKKKEKKPELDVLEFFKAVKLCTEESKQTYIERTEPYLVAIKQAKEMGQQALVDKLNESLRINRDESVLYASGYGKKIEEEQMVEFAKKSEKGINLVYIKNFTRPIPSDIAAKKQAIDKLEVFDNYCVLFYDTTGNMSDKTAIEKEIERKKKADPILFGMIKNSRSLYYVADWTDEYCDLTLAEFLRVSGIGEEKIKIEDQIKIEGL